MKPVQTAMLSFGMSGWVFHAPFLAASPHYHLAAVWERSKKNAQKTYPHIQSVDTYEALLQDEAIELVIVNTPNSSHFDYALRALEARKHVVVEKPFTITVEEAEALQEKAAAKGLVLTVYHNRRFDSDFLSLRQVVEEGLLGSIVEAEFHFDRFKEELSPKKHKEQPGPGAGILYDLGSHLIDQALQLFGTPEAVFADLAIMRPVSQVDDYFELLLFYKGSRVRLRGSYLVREPVPSFVLHGTKGSFHKHRTDVQEAQLQAHKPVTDPSWGREPEGAAGLLHTEVNGNVINKHITAPPGNYGNFYEQLYQAIRRHAPPPVTPQEGTQVIRVITKAIESNETKKVVPF
jgi:scyllo-inositol 2-dehydrogenase (NADP+)